MKHSRIESALTGFLVLMILISFPALSHEVDDRTAPHPMELESLVQILKYLNVEPTEPIRQTPRTFRVVGRMGGEDVVLVVDRLSADVQNERTRTSLMRRTTYAPSSGADYSARLKASSAVPVQPGSYSRPLSIAPRLNVIREPDHP